MPETMTVSYELFKFEELEDSAKETARDWWRACDDSDDYCEYEDFARMGAILGIEFSDREIPLMNGSTRKEPTVYWSGFSSQGDGACFEGSYSYAKGSQKAIRAEAPSDERLHQIADDLFAAQSDYFFSLEASVRHSGHYYHSGCTEIRVIDGRDDWDAAAEAHEAIAEALRDFMNWMYRQLEAEHDYRRADEQVDEAITMNEYTFDEDGNRKD
jgi:hypothetical protein